MIGQAHAAVNLVWQINPAQMWETDWLFELLKGVDIHCICDNGMFETYVDNAIIVLSAPRSLKRAQYFKKLKDLHYKFGVIQLSDEKCSYPTDYYDDAQFVFRNYWDQKFNSTAHVFTFPNGYKSGFWAEFCDEIKTSCQRKYTWSFAGELKGKKSRTVMVSYMKNVPGHHIHTTQGFGSTDPKSLNTAAYRNLLLDSIFIPCPAGWSIETFRVWEALECGCIPIVEKFPFDYYGSFIPEHPFLAVDSWQEAVDIVNDLLAQPEKLEALRQKCHMWWLAHKKMINKTFVDVIKKTLY